MNGIDEKLDAKKDEAPAIDSWEAAFAALEQRNKKEPEEAPVETDSLMQESPDKQKVPVEVMPNLWLKASPMMHSWMARTLEEAALLTEQLEKQFQSLITQLRK